MAHTSRFALLRRLWGLCRVGGLAALLLGAGAAHAAAQTAPGLSHPSLPQPLGQPIAGDSGDAPDLSSQNERLLRALNLDRQKSLVNDTNKLLRLATELNAEIARTNPAALTADQLHKLAEIEKLARNVKEKMATSVRGTPAFEPPFQPVHN